MRRGRGAWTRFGEEPGKKGHRAGFKCHRAGVVVPGRRAGGRRCWSSTVIRSGSSASTSNGNSMAHCARSDPPLATSLPPLCRTALRVFHFQERLGGARAEPVPWRGRPTLSPSSQLGYWHFLLTPAVLLATPLPHPHSPPPRCHGNALLLGLACHCQPPFSPLVNSWE